MKENSQNVAPHDSFFRSVFKAPERAAELLRFAARKNESLAEFLKTVDLSTLTEISESFSDTESFGYADLAFTVRIANHGTAPNLQSTDLLVGILEEHKSAKDPTVVKQLINYWFHIIVKNQKNVPTIAIVFYNGKDRWKLDAKTMFPQYPKYYHKIGLPFVFELVDLGDALDAESIKNLSAKMTLALLAMNYAFHGENKGVHLREAVKQLAAMPKDEAGRFLDETFLYLKRWLNSTQKEELRMDFITASEAYGYETIVEAEEKELTAKYEEGRDEGIGIGMERGREEGIEIGDLNARREIAKALKNNGASLDLIANVSGLSEEEIRNL